MKQEILGIEEEDSLVGKLEVEVGNFIQLSNFQEEIEAGGYVTSHNKEWVRLSTGNPLKIPSKASREFLFLPAIKYELKYFKYYSILNKNGEEDIKKNE